MGVDRRQVHAQRHRALERPASSSKNEVKTQVKTRIIAILSIVFGLSTGLMIGSTLAVQLSSAGSQRAADSEPQRPIVSLATQQNPVLGYQIDLPAGYRRARGLILPPDREMVGHDAYVGRTEIQELELCLANKESGLLSPERAHDVRVEVHRDIRRVSAVDWIRLTGRTVHFTVIEPLTVNGYEAARVVHQPSGDTALYVIRANDSLYLITRELDVLPSAQAKGWLDQIASTFRAFSTRDEAPTPVKPPCGS